MNKKAPLIALIGFLIFICFSGYMIYELSVNNNQIAIKSHQRELQLDNVLRNQKLVLSNQQQMIDRLDRLEKKQTLSLKSNSVTINHGQKTTASQPVGK